jgi:hypothetical protein
MPATRTGLVLGDPGGVGPELIANCWRGSRTLRHSASL